MQLSPIIDVGIGLVTTYLLLSLICTTVNEMIATAMKLRASMLQATVSELIDAPNLRAAFYGHGLIGGAAVSSTAGKLTASATQTAAAGGKPADAHPSYFDSRSVALALLGSLAPGQPLPGFDAIEELAGQLPADSSIKSVLLANIGTANRDIGQLRDNLAAWFDSSMARLNGSYSRRLKVISLIVGLVLAAVLNVDSLQLARSAWADPPLREQLVSAGAGLLKTAAPESSCIPDDAKAASSNPANTSPLHCELQNLSTYGDVFRPLPFGWWSPGLPLDVNSGNWLVTGDFWLWALMKLLGVLWSGIALSLGAPFWFDVLQRLMNVRGAGDKPQPQAK